MTTNLITTPPDSNGIITVAAPVGTVYVYAVNGTTAASVEVPSAGAPTIALSAISGVPNEPDRPVQLADTYNYNDDNYTDVAPFVQAELNKGPRTITWDKAVTMTQVRLGSNHRLQATSRDKGAILRRRPTPGVTQPNGYQFVCEPLFLNKNLTFNPAAIVDENISIIGGTWNGKGPDQIQDNSTGFLGIARFFGVRNLTLDGGQFVNARTFAVHFANINVGVFRNLLLTGNPSQSNTDGLHFNSKCTNVLIENCEFVGLRDDALALNGSRDPLKAGYFPTYTGYDGMDMYSGMDNFTIRNCHTTAGRWFLRVLPSDSAIQNNTVDGLSGTTNDYWQVLDNFTLSPQTVQPTDPNVYYAKNLSFTHISIECLADDNDEQMRRLGTCIVGCNTDNINWQYRTRQDFTHNVPTFYLNGYRHGTNYHDDHVATDSNPSSAFSKADFRYEGSGQNGTGRPQILGTFYNRRARQTRAAGQRAAPYVEFINTDVPGGYDLTDGQFQNIAYVAKLQNSTVNLLDLSGTTHTGGIKRVYLDAQSSITTIRFVGYSGSLASLVDGPGAANVTNLVTT